MERQDLMILHQLPMIPGVEIGILGSSFDGLEGTRSGGRSTQNEGDFAFRGISIIVRRDHN
jgi:hypothetical protein